MNGRVLIVAGSDSGGGAGIQADIKTVTALGGYAMTAITALTAQNTRGVFGVFPVDLGFIRQQIELVATDIGADVVKTGMLATAEVIDTVADALAEYAPGVPVVIDPVMVAKGGAPLLAADAASTLARRLLPLAAVVTPNAPEAAALAGFEVRTIDDMKRAGEKLCRAGAAAALVKGGHIEGAGVTDVLVTPQGIELFEGPRLPGTSTHGTGCTLASAIATGLAQKLPLRDAVARARAYVVEAIRTAPGLGHGHGPLNHAHTVRPFDAPSLSPRGRGRDPSR
ncbi:MAG: hydroxymethylpyrimidine/phosphomethylpyrimidine kinase [Alphaproteobacteria bacterium]|nr:MAG: hydroxymethylpyrimidine/phosphomethylpyrimidine kinase [Alphaproteobacteria bacterium]